MFVIRLRTLVIYFTAAILLITVFTAFMVKSDDFSVHAQEESGVFLPILMYHAVTEDPARIGQFVISSDMLEADLKYLQQEGYQTVTIDELIQYVKGDGTLPEKPVMLTFDDGYFNNYCYAYPLLQKYQAKAVISLIGKYTDLYTNTPDENPGYSHITWDQVNEMMQSGLVEFQNHSYDLHSNTKGRDGAKKKKGESEEAYAQMLWADVGRLQEEMKVHTGYMPSAFTYPFGSVSEASYEILEKMGFEATLSCEEKLNCIVKGDPNCLFMLNRFLRSNKKSAENILRAAMN